MSKPTIATDDIAQLPLLAVTSTISVQLSPPPTRSRGRITLHTGAWEHDEAQARLLADRPNVAVVVHPEDTHRVALALQQQGQLLPLVRAAILDEARQGS